MGKQQSVLEKSSKRSLLWVVLVVGAIALVLDLWSKSWALNNLTEGQKRPFIGDFISLQLIHNPGAAFSLGEGSTWIFTVLSIVILGFIIWYSMRTTSLPMAILLGLLAGGAAGNLWDRLTRPPSFGQGYVVDFLNYNDWFIGNVADIWIVGGVFALVAWKILEDSRDARRDSDGAKEQTRGAKESALGAGEQSRGAGDRARGTDRGSDSAQEEADARQEAGAQEEADARQETDVRETGRSPDRADADMKENADG